MLAAVGVPAQGASQSSCAERLSLSVTVCLWGPKRTGCVWWIRRRSLASAFRSWPGCKCAFPKQTTTWCSRCLTMRRQACGEASQSQLWAVHVQCLYVRPSSERQVMLCINCAGAFTAHAHRNNRRAAFVWSFNEAWMVLIWDHHSNTTEQKLPCASLLHQERRVNASQGAQQSFRLHIFHSLFAALSATLDAGIGVLHPTRPVLEQGSLQTAECICPLQ